MRKPKGFTLVELLVVIGIIALLVGILMPALNRARGQANALKCASNLRSMGQAMTMYINQWHYYPGQANFDGANYYAVWPTRLRLFMNGNQGIFQCPSQDADFDWVPSSFPAGSVPANANAEAFGYTTGEPLLMVHGTAFSYGYNDWGYNFAQPTASDVQRGLGGDVWGGLKQLKASRVKRPTEMIAIADNTRDLSWDFNIDPRADQQSEWPGKIHNKGANVLFCDGHVAYMPQADLLRVDGTPVGLSMRRMWNNDNQP